MIIIGLSGTNGSGKDSIAHMLVEKYGFFFADATKMLGDELTKRGLPTERQYKSQLSAEWRREHGMAAIVQKGIELFESSDGRGLVISSLRHPGEADRVHELSGMVIWVDADPEVRYKRITSNDRGRVEDRKTYDEFLAEQQREMTPSGDGATLNMLGVKERSDIFIENNGNDIEAFKQDVEQKLLTILPQ